MRQVMKSSQAKARSVQAKSAPKPAAAKAGAAKAARPDSKPARPAAGKAEAAKKQAAPKTAAASEARQAVAKPVAKAAELRGPAPATRVAKPAAAKPAQAKKAEAAKGEATKPEAKAAAAAKPDQPAPPPPAAAAAAAASASPPTTAPKQPEAAKPAAPRPQHARPQPAPNPAAASSEPQPEFAVGDHVVYPTHGVGKVTGIVTEEIAGHRLTLIVIEFEENRMVLRVPVAKARSAGLRKLSSRKAIEAALATLKGRARIKRTMWSRRAQEYEAKINSGDPVAIAEVVRDLHRNAGQPDQSFSERQIYEQAMDRLAAELAAIDGVDKSTAQAKLATMLKAA
jgi:CarD family transcriptional regulator